MYEMIVCRKHPDVNNRGITRLVPAPPVHKVRGRVENIYGRYPSPKLQRSIQFESQHVELWGIYAMEVRTV